MKISGDKIVNTSYVFIVRQLMWSKLEKVTHHCVEINEIWK